MTTFCKKKCALLVFVGLLISSAYAQNDRYTLNELINAARNNYPALLQKQALIKGEQATARSVKHSFLPSLYVGDELNIGSDNSLAGAYLPGIIVPSVSSGIAGTNNPEAASGNIATFYSQYTLLNFGLHKAELNNALDYVTLGKADFEKELYLTKLQICQLYFDLLRNQYSLNVAVQNIERYQHIFDIIRALTESGIKAGTDSSLAKAELSSAKISYNQTAGKINQIKSQLTYFTGIAAPQLAIDTLRIPASMTTLDSSNMDSTNNPLIAYYLRQKDIFLSNEKLISKSYLPKVSLGVSGFARGSSIQYNNDYKDLATGLGYQRFNYLAGVSVSYDLFNGIYKQDKLAVNRYNLEASDYALQQQKLALLSASSQADAAISTAIANLQELPNQTNAATAVYQQKMAQYKAGLITLIDLTNASFVLYRSQNDYIEALNDWYLAKLYKAEATGNLDLFIQSLK